MSEADWEKKQAFAAKKLAWAKQHGGGGRYPPALEKVRHCAAHAITFKDFVMLAKILQSSSVILFQRYVYSVVGI